VTGPSPQARTSAADPTRRYALLSFLQWLPIGLMMVPMVLLLLERGFSLAEIAVLGGVSAGTVAVLELPTGGLADVVGRRPVLVASALAHAAALLLLGLTAGLALLLVSAVLRGVSRALSTGPLEAWYVDTVRAVRPETDDTAHLTSGLARGEMAASVALGVGALVGGVLPVIMQGVAAPMPALAVPIVLAAAVEGVRVACTVGLPDISRPTGSAMRALRGVPATVASGVRLASRDRVVLRLLLVAATTGVALAVLELVTPAWLDRLVGDSERAALGYAVLVTVGFGADALGAAAAPAARRRLSTPAMTSAVATAGAVAAAVGLAAATLLTGLEAVLLAGVAYVGFFVGLGAAGPPLGELLHGQVRSAERATVLSVQSLVLQLAGAAGALLAGALTAQYGAWVGFGVAAVALGAAVRLLLRMRRGDAAPPAARSSGARTASP
jgi:MFS family permease